MPMRARRPTGRRPSHTPSAAISPRHYANAIKNHSVNNTSSARHQSATASSTCSEVARPRALCACSPPKCSLPAFHIHHSSFPEFFQNLHHGTQYRVCLFSRGRSGFWRAIRNRTASRRATSTSRCRISIHHRSSIYKSQSNLRLQQPYRSFFQFVVRVLCSQR